MQLAGIPSDKDYADAKSMLVVLGVICSAGSVYDPAYETAEPPVECRVSRLCRLLRHLLLDRAGSRLSRCRLLDRGSEARPADQVRVRLTRAERFPTAGFHFHPQRAPRPVPCLLATPSQPASVLEAADRRIEPPCLRVRQLHPPNAVVRHGFRRHPSDIILCRRKQQAHAISFAYGKRLPVLCRQTPCMAAWNKSRRTSFGIVFRKISACEALF